MVQQASYVSAMPYYSHGVIVCTIMLWNLTVSVCFSIHTAVTKGIPRNYKKTWTGLKMVEFLGQKEIPENLDKAERIINTAMNPTVDTCAAKMVTFVGNDFEDAIKEWPGGVFFPDGRKVQSIKDIQEWWLLHDITPQKFAILFQTLRYGTWSEQENVVTTTVDTTAQDVFLSKLLWMHFGVGYCDDNSSEDPNLKTKNGQRSACKGGFLDKMITEKRQEQRRQIDPLWSSKKRNNATHDYNVRRHTPKDSTPKDSNSADKVSRKRSGTVLRFDAGMHVLLKGVKLENLPKEYKTKMQMLFLNVTGETRVMGSFSASATGDTKWKDMDLSELPPESDDSGTEEPVPKTSDRAAGPGSEQMSESMRELQQECKLLKAQNKLLKADKADVESLKATVTDLYKDVKKLSQAKESESKRKHQQQERSISGQTAVKKMRLEAEEARKQKRSSAGKPTEEALLRAAMARKVAKAVKVRNSGRFARSLHN